MLKRFENLGIALNRNESKKVMGGGDGLVAGAEVALDSGIGIEEEGLSRVCWYKKDHSVGECCNGCSCAEAEAAATLMALATGDRYGYCCRSCPA
jgi:hypothetical protein